MSCCRPDAPGRKNRLRGSKKKKKIYKKNILRQKKMRKNIRLWICAQCVIAAESCPAAGIPAAGLWIYYGVYFLM